MRLAGAGMPGREKPGPRKALANVTVAAPAACGIRGRKSVHKHLKLISGCVAAAVAFGIGAISAQAAEVTVGLITKTETNPFFVKMREGAQAKAKELGINLITAAGKYDGDNDGQVAAIENLISAGAKGFAIVPSDSKAIVPTIKKARDAGLMVIVLDTPLDPMDAADRDIRHRQPEGRLADRRMGQGNPRRQGQGCQDRPSSILP